MIQMVVEKQYIDVFQGSIYCTLRGENKKLCEFVFTNRTEFKYKGEPISIDGVYPAVYRSYDSDGYMFRPMVNHRVIPVRYQSRKNPDTMIKNVFYILVRKDKWQDMCRLLYGQGEHHIEIKNYMERRSLEMIPEVLLNIEDDDDKLLDEWENEDF